MPGWFARGWPLPGKGPAGHDGVAATLAADAASISSTAAAQNASS